MKRNLLVAGLILAGGMSFGQNFQDNKVSFSYTQLPTNPIDKQYTNYEVVLVRSFEKANEDSLNAYNLRLQTAQSQYDSEMAVWKEQKKNIDRTHLSAMAAWEKQQNAGTVTQMPVKPEYPPQPVMQEVFEPQLHEDISDNQVKQTFNLQGYNQGTGGATVTVTIQAISGINVIEKMSGTGTSTKYEYSCQYQMPVEIKVESPSQGVIWNTFVNMGVQTYPMKAYGSKYEYQLWMLDNRQQFWTELQTYARNEGLKDANNQLNNTCGFPTYTWHTEVYSVKKYKDWSYDDLLDAYTIASQGYDLVIQQRDHSAAKPKLTEAIGMWEKALSESNLSDNKARINDEVTAMCYYNIAEAYFWMNEFDQAEVYINKAINGGKYKFKTAANGLKGNIDNFKMRYNANF